MPYLGRTVVTNLADYHVDGYTHVGSSPSSSQFIAGTTTALTLTNAGVEDEQALSVYFNGVHQQHNTYSISNSVVTFDAAIPTGTDKIEIHYGTQPVTSGLAADSVDSNQLVNGSIDTAHIGDDQVTLAKMASGTDGNIISYDASGNPVAIATGTAGHFLKSQGAGNQPVFAAAGGAWTLISTAAIDDDASADFTGLSATYDTYAFVISDLKIATDDADIHMRLGDSSGFDSGSSDYLWVGAFRSSDGAPDGTLAGDGGEAQINLNVGSGAGNIGVGNATGEGFGGIVFLHQPSDGVIKPLITSQSAQIQNDGKLGFTVMAGMRNAVITCDRAQFLAESGNLTSGRITAFGISHA